jgi:rod shape-determining protein MreC
MRVTKAVLSVKETTDLVINIRFLSQENKELAQENRFLKASLADKEEVIRENDLLRSELSLPLPDRSKKGMAAFIIGRSSVGAFGTFLINRGSRDGLETGQAAISGGMLVGTLTDVYETTSILLPITNVNSVIPVALVESGGQGLLRGGIKGLSVGEISRDVSVKIGETVVTSRLGGAVPPGIMVGTVQALTGNPTDVFRVAAITSPLLFNWLELVVILPKE